MKKQNSSPSSEIVWIVDSDDNVVDSMARGEMRKKGLIYRVTYLLIFNRAGQVLVQTRTATKDMYPRYLDFAAGGVVLAGETYEESAARELEEELGIGDELTPLFDIYFEESESKPINRNWGRVFRGISEGPFALQVEEVSEAEFMDVTVAIKLPIERVTPDTRAVLVAWLLRTVPGFN